MGTNNEKKLAGKVAIVTGGSRGIGAAIVKRLAAEGASVGITYTKGADAAAKAIKDRFGKALFRMSSLLPPHALEAAARKGYDVRPGARGFVFNGDPSSIVQFYEIGTSLTGMTPYRWMDEITEPE